MRANHAPTILNYLDTGLFLDHRTTRALVAELAQGKRLLNLFGYTGSVTVMVSVTGPKPHVSVTDMM